MRMIPEILAVEAYSSTNNVTIQSCNWHVVLEDYDTNEVLASVYFNEHAAGGVNHGASTPSFAPWLLDTTNKKMVMTRTGKGYTSSRVPFGYPNTNNYYGGVSEFSY